MKSARPLLLSMVIAMLLISLLPMQAVQAQEVTTADLVVSLVSIPKHAKACQIFEAVYTVTNLGPDPASNLYLAVWIPDAYNVVDIVGLPDTLDAGETATVSVIIEVVAFVPGETRRAWVGVTAENYVDPSTDPNLENNSINTDMKIIGKHTDVCG